MQKIARANSTTVPMMVNQRLRMHHSNPAFNHRQAARLSLVSLELVAFENMHASTGAKNTATTHDTIRTAITANRVKVYSPAELALRPIGADARPRSPGCR